jgi:nitrogen fixation protein NifQ
MDCSPLFATRYATLIAAQQPAWSEAMAFDAHVFACVLASGPAEEPGALPAAMGLSGREAEALMARVFPYLLRGDILVDRYAPKPACDETDMLAELLIAHRAGDSGHELWFARILARRCLEPGHLWQALGLFSRAELRRVLETHFPALAARNFANMRWKKFLYRELCATQGYSACPVPDCRDCSTWSECFGPEEGVARLAA